MADDKTWPFNTDLRRLIEDETRDLKSPDLLRSVPDPRFQDWTFVPDIHWTDRNALNDPDKLKYLLLSVLVGNLGGRVNITVAELQATALKLRIDEVRLEETRERVIQLTTDHKRANPIQRVTEFADRWEQRAALLPPDAAGEIIDMATELRQVAEGLFR